MEKVKVKKLYAIGDVHGCYNTLVSLLRKIKEDSGDNPHKIVFLGDYIDRGPRSADVVQLLIDLSVRKGKTEYVFLRGNHEQMMFDELSGNSWGWYHNGGTQTVQSYNAYDVPMNDHAKWLRKNTQIFHRDGDFLFVHAGIDPRVSLNLQRANDALWERKWNDYSGDYPENVIVIHGHTPVETPYVRRRQINIDTGCVFHEYEGYGTLTAVRLDSRDEFSFIQVPYCD